MAQPAAEQRYISFVHHFLGDCLHNATKAAIAAGYSEKTAHVQGSKLLKLPKIQAMFQKIRGREEQRIVISKERILNELAKMGFANMADYLRIDEEGRASVDLSMLTRDQAAAIQEITIEESTEGRGDDSYAVRRTKFKLANKKESLELLGKHHKLFEDSGQVNVGVSVILMDVPRPGRPEGNPPPELPEKT
jgi:phage terminase small subunit